MKKQGDCLKEILSGNCGSQTGRFSLAAHELLEQATVPYVQDESENRRLNHYSFLPILAQLHGSSTLDKCDEEAELPFPQLPVKGYDTIPGGVGHHHFLSPTVQAEESNFLKSASKMLRFHSFPQSHS